MADVQEYPEYAIEILVTRKNPDEDTHEDMARVRYAIHAPDLESSLPVLNEGINERWGQLIEMANIAESPTQN